MLHLTEPERRRTWPAGLTGAGNDMTRAMCMCVWHEGCNSNTQIRKDKRRNYDKWTDGQMWRRGVAGVEHMNKFPSNRNVEPSEFCFVLAPQLMQHKMIRTTAAVATVVAACGLRWHFTCCIVCQLADDLRLSSSCSFAQLALQNPQK